MFIKIISSNSEVKTRKMHNAVRRKKRYSQSQSNLCKQIPGLMTRISKNRLPISIPFDRSQAISLSTSQVMN